METTNIYILIDPETQQVRYVGKANNISQRYKSHLNRARKHQIHKSNWINFLKTKGLKPIIEIIDVVPIENWVFWETYWISQFKTWGCNLINYTQGGDGATFSNQTSFKKGQKPWNTGKGNFKKCVICNKKFQSSQSAKKNSCSKECASVIKSSATSKTQFSKQHTPWNKEVRGYKTSKRKPVIQMDLQNNFIQEFESPKEASEKVGCGRANIESACRGEIKTAKNFKWKYKNEK